MGRQRIHFHLWLVALLALLARIVAVPLWRHQFDGIGEQAYVDAFHGAQWKASTQVYPLLAQLYSTLGHLFAAPQVLVVLNILAGLGTVAAAAWWSKKKWGVSVAWMVAILLALSPTHAFWSTSIYNVALPQCLLVLAVAVGGWRGALFFALACNMRVELALLAPVVWALSDWKSAAGAVGALVAWWTLGGTSSAPYFESAPPITSPSEALAVNVWIPDYLGPLGEPLGLVLVVLAIQRHNLAFFLAAVWVHVVGSAFDDYGTRHALLGGFCLILLLATTTGWRKVLPLCAASLFLFAFTDLHSRYQMREEAFVSQLPDVPEQSAIPAGCMEIHDDPQHPDSHWARRNNWPTGCVLWVETRSHIGWTSRGLQDRRLRMHRSYTLTPSFTIQHPGGMRLYYEVER